MGATVWTPDEQKWFDKVRDTLNRHNRLEAVKQSILFRDSVEYDPEKLAYAILMEAIALSVGWTENLRSQAEERFKTAYDTAMGEKSYAIAAYVLNESSVLASSDKDAANTIRRAIGLLKKAKSTPDKQRNLIADHAYFEACLCCVLYRLGEHEEARKRIAVAAGTLKDAADRWPRYVDEYLLSLHWTLSMYTKKSEAPKWIASAYKLSTQVLRRRKGKQYVEILLRKMVGI